MLQIRHLLARRPLATDGIDVVEVLELDDEVARALEVGRGRGEDGRELADGLLALVCNARQLVSLSS